MRGAVALLAVLGALVATGQASARTVAESQGYTLTATDDSSGFCLSLTGPGVIAGPECTDVRLGLRTDILQLRAPGVFAAAVAPAARRVTLETADGEQSFTPTAPQGFGARFVLAPATPPGTVVRFFDEADALFGAAVDANADALGERRTLIDGPAVHGRVTIAAGFAVRPDPVTLDRTVTVQCITGGFGDATQHCATHDEWVGRRLETAHGCGTERTLVFGFVSGATRRVALTLTTGRQLRVRPERLPDAYERLRAVAVRLPPGVGVRTAKLVGLGREMPLGLAPACAAPDTTVHFNGRSAPRGITPVAVAQGGGHRLVVADDTNRRLCVALDRFTRPCAVPAVKAADAELYQDDGVVGVSYRAQRSVLRW